MAIRGEGLLSIMSEDAKAGAYDREFFDDITTGSLRSARVIIPILLERVSVQSAVDVGCGRGTWLRALEEAGVTDIAGYDGDYVDLSSLLIDSTRFNAVDLCEDFEIGRNFDLAISLEVAEHLASKFAQALIRRLVTVAPIILFSASVPGQQGTNHVNEQWQDYWRSLFKSFGFYPADVIRPIVWGNPNVEYWYQQNIILYCTEQALKDNPGLRIVPEHVSLNMVHPTLYEIGRARADPRLKSVLKLLPGLAWRAASRRIRGGFMRSN
jgi:SAM-dependent methyltransferase